MCGSIGASSPPQGGPRAARAHVASAVAFVVAAAADKVADAGGRLQTLQRIGAAGERRRRGDTSIRSAAVILQSPLSLSLSLPPHFLYAACAASVSARRPTRRARTQMLRAVTRSGDVRRFDGAVRNLAAGQLGVRATSHRRAVKRPRLGAAATAHAASERAIECSDLTGG